MFFSFVVARTANFPPRLRGMAMWISVRSARAASPTCPHRGCTGDPCGGQHARTAMSSRPASAVRGNPFPPRPQSSTRRVDETAGDPFHDRPVHGLGRTPIGELKRLELIVGGTGV